MVAEVHYAHCNNLPHTTHWLVSLICVNMPRTPTNSLIIHCLDLQLQEDPNYLARLLASPNFNLELVHLPKFNRYILVCASATVAIEVKAYLTSALATKAVVDYSIRDNPSLTLQDNLWCLQSDHLDYLELPLEDGSRRFLILPPLSPHSEWDDYHKEEEGPNKKSVYSPEELSHLLWDRLGGFDSHRVRKFQLDTSDDEIEMVEKHFDISNPEVLFENIDKDVPAIVVDSVRNQGPRMTMPKTTMPPPQS